MGNRRARGGLLGIAACAMLSSTAIADRKVEAQQLFGEGKTLMTEQKYAEACKKFAASNALAPSASTLMNLGACQEADKKLASAWGTFKEAANLAARTDPPLFDPSSKRAAALEPRLSSLQVDVPVSSRVDGLEIMRDGVALMEAQWGSRIFVDGGEYEIVARAPGTVAWATKISVATELDRRMIEIPRLLAESETRVDTAGLPSPVARPEPEPEPPPVAEGPSSFTPRRKIALGVGAVGVAALGGGIVLGMKAKGYQEDSDAICPTTTCNDPEGLQLNQDARSTGTKATILFAVGGVAVAGGVVLWIMGKPVAPMVSDDSVGLMMVGEL